MYTDIFCNLEINCIIKIRISRVIKEEKEEKKENYEKCR